MSGWTPWRRDGRRLPGSLCDETPRPAEAGRWQPRDDSEYDSPQVEVTPEEAARWRAWLRARDADPTAGTPVAAAVQEEIARLLAERDTETQRADRAEALLRDANGRIRGLEFTVAAMSGHPAATPLRVADDQLLVQPLPAAWPPEEWTT